MMEVGVELVVVLVLVLLFLVLLSSDVINTVKTVQTQFSPPSQPPETSLPFLATATSASSPA